ncbi:ABC transporter ATP-binding protein [Myxococcus stipitatus]|uniref:ABC transporter ATP-binding protein n=1 Tax=Myxococcus stipitatus TaxID=83455 RepID=UPI001F47CD3F|nr:ABC transporter ATP-binding protein [Myxococcus stipitatus]MCE9670307.1 ABC transporter ATP-binding protein [Myxococcus stipitatus]
MELRLEGVSKTYPNGTRALNDVSLTIPRGMFGLLGPNGAGKSTLMRSIATLQDVDAGAMTFDGIDVRRDKARLRDVLGFLPQDFGVYPKVTAWDMLDHLAQLKGLSVRRTRHDAVKALLTKTNLWEHRDRRLGGFSGGMKQRFGIAQALLGDPKLLIVDEPTAGLDPAERFRFHNLLAEISTDVVVLLSTHIVSDVADLCQNMAVLAQGRVVASGHPLRLVEELQGRVWKRFVGAQDELDALAKQLEVIAVRRVAGQRLVHVYAESAPAGFEPANADLEDVYFHALSRASRQA